jgi:hypothetical protein
MPTKDKKFGIKTTEPYRNLIHGVANVIGKDASEFARDAMNEKIKRLAKSDPKVAELVQTYGVAA